MTAPLRRVFVRRPGGVERWQEYGWRAAPDPVRIVEEHEAFVAALEAAGAEVVVGEPLDSALDAIYVHDPAAVTSHGAVLLRPGKELRQVEVDAIERDFAAAGVDVLARLEAPATAEGGDMLWLDERTLVVGRGYRTNDAGVDALRAALPDVEVHAVDLPHYHGRDEVMHLLSLISPLADDLAVVYLPLHAGAAGRAARGSAGSASSRCRTKSSSRWRATCSRSHRASRSRSTATRRRAGGWRLRASTCVSTPVRSCRARATAARPA